MSAKATTLTINTMAELQGKVSCPPRSCPFVQPVLDPNGKVVQPPRSSGFILFVMASRRKVQAKVPDADAGLRHLSEMWKDLSETKKMKYKTMAAHDLKRFEHEIKKGVGTYVPWIIEVDPAWSVCIAWKDGAMTWSDDDATFPEMKRNA